jgi:hypothetical protein
MSTMKLFSRGMLGKLEAKDETCQRDFSDETATDSGLGSEAMEKAGVGDAIGVTAGAILAILGPGVVIADPIATAFAGAVRGRTGRRDHRRADRLRHSRRASKTL